MSAARRRHSSRKADDGETNGAAEKVEEVRGGGGLLHVLLPGLGHYGGEIHHVEGHVCIYQDQVGGGVVLAEKDWQKEAET